MGSAQSLSSSSSSTLTPAACIISAPGPRRLCFARWPPVRRDGWCRTAGSSADPLLPSATRKASSPFSRTNPLSLGDSRGMPAPINTCFSSSNVARSTHGAAHYHLRTRDRIEHPAGDADDDASRSSACTNWPVALCSTRRTEPCAENRMPSVVDFQLLPDMGRMNG